MEEQNDFKRKLENAPRNINSTVRGIFSVIRFFKNKAEEPLLKEKLKEQKKSEEEDRLFKERFKNPQEQDFDFMLNVGKTLDYQVLDSNTDMDRLRGFLNSEKLHYCIRESTLDGKPELVYFRQDRERIKRIIEHSINESLKAEQERPQTFDERVQAEAYARQTQLGYTPQREDNVIYESYEETPALEMEGYGLPAETLVEMEVAQSVALDAEVDLDKVQSFFKKHELLVTFGKNQDGTTQMFMHLRKDKLPEQVKNLEKAFISLSNNPSQVRKVQPLLENVKIAKAKSTEMAKDVAKEKAKSASKNLTDTLGKGLSR